jgi:KDO2-lipid IV(A) lauroyltransferase
MIAWYRHRYHTLLSHRMVFAVMPRLPRVLHPVAAVVTAAIFFLLLGAERRSVIRNLRTVRGRGGLRTVWATYRVFYSFCDFIVSYCFVPSADRAGLEAMLSHGERGAHTIDACLSRGDGLIVWTAHLGNWELASRLLELHGRPVNVARLVESGNPAEAMLRDLMVNPNLRIVDLSDPLASVQLLNALRRNEIVAIQGDRVYRADSALEVSLFGRPARLPSGPFALAYASGAPLLPGFVVRTGWLRYRVILGEPMVFDRAVDRETAIRKGLSRASTFLEAQLSQYGDQWLNFYDFWDAPVVDPP